jgi:Nucleotidyltransferase of unknown function (DUF6036)
VRREHLEHVIRAAADVTKDEIVVVGSQAILGQYPQAPDSLLVSIEADLYPRSDPRRADEIDAALGDGSRFHETYGYYAHGVGPETPVAPAGWQERLVRLELPAILPREGTVVAWCLEAHDLVLAKLAAGRERDLGFAAEAIRAGLVDSTQLRLGVELMPETHRELTRERLDGVARSARL